MLKEVELVDVKFSGTNDVITSATALLKDDSGIIENVALWYDRKFLGVGLRIGDRLTIQLNKTGQWSLKGLVKQSDVDTPVVFPDGIFPNRRTVADFLMP